MRAADATWLDEIWWKVHRWKSATATEIMIERNPIMTMIFCKMFILIFRPRFLLYLWVASRSSPRSTDCIPTIRID